MLLELVHRLRGIERWPVTTATVDAVTSMGQRGGIGYNKITFSYVTPLRAQTGKLSVDSQGSLYNVGKGDSFQIQFNPQNESRFYCREAQAFGSEVRLWAVLVILAFIMYKVAAKSLR